MGIIPPVKLNIVLFSPTFLALSHVLEVVFFKFMTILVTILVTILSTFVTKLPPHHANMWH